MSLDICYKHERPVNQLRHWELSINRVNIGYMTKELYVVFEIPVTLTKSDVNFLSEFIKERQK